MNYAFCHYRGRYVSDTKEYVSAIRAGFFNISYDPKKRNQMLEEIEGIIDFNSSVDLYAFAHLLYDDKGKYSISRCSSILDIIVSWNYVPAKFLLGQLYFFGLGYKTDLKKFFELTSEAAKENFIPAKNSLGVAYLNGYGCKVDVAKGKELLEECVQAHYGVAYFNIGYSYHTGSFGYPKDMYKAFGYYKEAATQYYTRACYNMAVMYLGGIGCTKDIEKGLYELKWAAELGHLKAQTKLGDIYYFGELTKKNLDSAYHFYMLAAEQKDPYGMYSVGYMIIHDEKPFIEKSIGYAWLRRAADAGYESAKKYL